MMLIFVNSIEMVWSQSHAEINYGVTSSEIRPVYFILEKKVRSKMDLPCHI